MSAILTPPPVAAPTATQPAPTAPPEPAIRLLTAGDLACFPSDLPSGPVRYELHHGRLVVMPPPGDFHSVMLTRLGHALMTQGELAGHGEARTGEFGLLLGRDPDRLYGPDSGFITKARLPVVRSSEGYLETIPELLVEARSPNDTLAYTASKAEIYLAAGAVLVWVLDPVGRRVFAYRAGAAPTEMAEDQALTCEDLIPGFRLVIRDTLPA